MAYSRRPPSEGFASPPLEGLAPLASLEDLSVISTPQSYRRSLLRLSQYRNSCDSSRLLNDVSEEKPSHDAAESERLLPTISVQPPTPKERCLRPPSLPPEARFVNNVSTFATTSTPVKRPQKRNGNAKVHQRYDDIALLEFGERRKKVEFLTPRFESDQLLRHSQLRNSQMRNGHAKNGGAKNNNHSYLKELSFMDPPVDRLNLIYLTFLLHGIGTLTPWNMFITAKELKQGDWLYTLNQYFVKYKLSKEYTEENLPYATHFLQYIGFAAQVPNVIFNWINIFCNVGNNFTPRIVWTLLVEVIVFVFTIVLAMVNSSEWPGLFFYLTVGSVIVLNVANGIFQNTVYGLVAKLPVKYTGAVVLGSNLCGTLVALIHIASLSMTPNPRTAAIYFFIMALFILLACFDTYFALPLNRFYRYHDHLHTKSVEEKRRYNVVHALPYWTIFKQCFPQLFNVFFTYFITLTIFPAIHSDIGLTDHTFFIPDRFFTPITCFLTFNVAAVVGNLFPSLGMWPTPRWLFIPTLLRALLLPFFLLCNYLPNGYERLWPILIPWNGAYWAGAFVLGITHGHCSSLAMMYAPRTVAPEYSSTAAMFGAASIVTGIFAGIAFSYLMPILISTPELSFERPDWWPTFKPTIP